MHIFLERGRKRDKGGESHPNHSRDKSQNSLFERTIRIKTPFARLSKKEREKNNNTKCTFPRPPIVPFLGLVLLGLAFMRLLLLLHAPFEALNGRLRLEPLGGGLLLESLLLRLQLLQLAVEAVGLLFQGPAGVFFRDAIVVLCHTGWCVRGLRLLGSCFRGRRPCSTGRAVSRAQALEFVMLPTFKQGANYERPNKHRKEGRLRCPRSARLARVFFAPAARPRDANSSSSDPSGCSQNVDAADARDAAAKHENPQPPAALQKSAQRQALRGKRRLAHSLSFVGVRHSVYHLSHKFMSLTCSPVVAPSCP